MHAASLPRATVNNKLKYTKMLILSHSKELHIASSPEIISTVMATEANAPAKDGLVRLHTKVTSRTCNTCSRLKCNTGMNEELWDIVFLHK